MPVNAKRVREIFLAAIETTDATERIALLDRECAADLELRQRVEVLLRADQDRASILKEPARALSDVQPADDTIGLEPAADSPPPPLTQDDSAAQRDDDPLSFLTPSIKPGHLGRLDHYEILEVIGKGGFGTVLKAFDEKLHRIVAIKVLSPELSANGPARNRFIRAARTGAAVVHEHVVTIHAVDEEHRPPYLVMQLIDGMTLQEKIDNVGTLCLREILCIGMQMAEGLAAAHKQGLVHRDIKPANILLENGVERVKITDFGLARAVDDASVTQSGTVAGTPMYMSPEQAEGLPIDHRSDLFSLGTVLYAMCTGHPPFRASGTHAVLKRVIDASPRPIREINNEVPDWLCDIVAKLHAKKPEERFQKATEVAELLGQHLAHLQQPTMVVRPAPVEIVKTAKPWQVGDRAWAPWEENWLYPATIQEVKVESVFVAFDDGATESVPLKDVRRLDLDKGRRVFGFWTRLFGSGYYPATITEVKGNQIHLAYDDGDKEWTEPAWIRIPVDEAAMPARPKTSPSASGTPSSGVGWLLSRLIVVAAMIGVFFGFYGMAFALLFLPAYCFGWWGTPTVNLGAITAALVMWAAFAPRLGSAKMRWTYAGVGLALLAGGLAITEVSEHTHFFHTPVYWVDLSVDNPNFALKVVPVVDGADPEATILAHPVQVQWQGKKKIAQPPGRYWFAAIVHERVAYFQLVDIDGPGTIVFPWAEEFTKTEKQRLQGTWRILTVELDGKVPPELPPTWKKNPLPVCGRSSEGISSRQQHDPGRLHHRPEQEARCSGFGRCIRTKKHSRHLPLGRRQADPMRRRKSAAYRICHEIRRQPHSVRLGAR
jgi:serine/threonine protein kinase